MPLSIRIGDPVGLVNNIARLYQSVTRILMEYVDNSLDDAEEVYRASGDRYPERVGIRVRINKKSRQAARGDPGDQVVPEQVEVPDRPLGAPAPDRLR